MLRLFCGQKRFFLVFAPERKRLLDIVIIPFSSFGKTSGSAEGYLDVLESKHAVTNDHGLCWCIYDYGNQGSTENLKFLDCLKHCKAREQLQSVYEWSQAARLTQVICVEL